MPDLTSPLKLHLGCWKRFLPGFVHIDLADFPHIDYRRSVDDLSIFEDDSVDFIYASTVLEYFSFKQAPQVLQEWCRVLKPGSAIKIAVPDFESMISYYKKTGRVLDLQGLIYGSMSIPTPDGNSQSFGHKMLYDFKLLKQLLEQNGFKSVGRYDWRQFLPVGEEDASAAYIPSHDYQNGILMSLNVQAVKAGPIETSFLKGKHLAVRIGNKALRETKKLLK